jgi:hypothetical protein
MLTTDQMRAKLAETLDEAERSPDGKASLTIERDDMAVLVMVDLEEALKALGTSQRVMQARRYIVQAQKALDALIKGLAEDAAKAAAEKSEAER